MTTKTCFKCRCEKPLGAFYRHSQMADGHLNKCIECSKNDVRAHRAVNLEKVRAYDRAWPTAKVLAYFRDIGKKIGAPDANSL